MRYIDLLHSAISNAQRGLTAEQVKPIEDAIAIADTLFPIVSQGVCESAAASEYRRSLVSQTKTLTIAAGTVELTGDVLTHFMPDSVLLNPSNATQRYAWRPYPDFVKRGDRRLGIYSIKGDRTLVCCAPNVGFTIPLTTAGTFQLIVPCAVDKPAVYTDEVDVSEELLSDLNEALENALRGQMLIKEAGRAA